MAYADQQMGGSKVTSIFIVALIHVAVGYLLISGLAISAAKKVIERVTTVDIEEPPPPPEDEPPPPPPDQPQAPPPPVAPPPPISIAPAPPRIQTQATIPPPAPPAIMIPPPAPPAPPPAPSQARGARPKNERSWFARIQDNYPAAALRQGVEGTVGVRATVTERGRATGCQVTSSSGSSALDQAACRDLERYGQFNPALDNAGNPTTGTFATRIVYRID
jgi:periplasmic protein TonB